MPITILDGIVIGVALFSAVLAMVRGFSREVLSVASWVGAAAAAYFLYPVLLPYAKDYTTSDTVAMVGQLGRSAAGYGLWRHDIEQEIDDFPELRRAHLVPSVPYGQGRAAADAGATAMTDVSDGLLADARHVADASGVCLDLSRVALQADHDAVAAAAAAVGEDPWGMVLGGGEDHALVATFPGAAPAGWRSIGVVLDGPPSVLVDGAEWTGPRGWRSF